MVDYKGLAFDMGYIVGKRRARQLLVTAGVSATTAQLLVLGKYKYTIQPALGSLIQSAFASSGIVITAAE